MNATVNIGALSAAEVIDHIRDKSPLPTKFWDDLLGEAHAHAFTIAGATKADLLADLHTALAESIANGETITGFRKRFDQIVERHGWEYNGTRGWRTRVIYDNNLRTAHMAARWKKLQRLKQRRPYLIYMSVGDSRVRQQHREWHSLVLPIDHPWWDTHYPPNGWGCRCYVRSASERDLQRQGLQVGKPPPIKTSRRVNTKTGEDYGEVPIGIDTGWDYNVGKAWLGPSVALGKKLVDLPTPVAAAVVQSNKGHLRALTAAWQNWLQERNGKPPQNHAFPVGYLSPAVIAKLRGTDIEPASSSIVVFDRKLRHLSGGHKGETKRFPPSWVSNLPAHLANYKAVIRHGSEIIIVLNATTGDKNGRAVVQVNFKKKGVSFNTIQSLGVLELHNLIGNLQRDGFELLDGSLE